MLGLSKRTDYALIALSHLSGRPDRCVSARDIAAAYGLPQPMLMNLLKDLNQHGLVASTRGVRGGYQLAVDLDGLSLFELIQIVDGQFALTECAPDRPDCAQADVCRVSGRCPMQAPMQALHMKFEQFLKGVKVSDLVVAGRRIDVPLELVGIG